MRGEQTLSVFEREQIRQAAAIMLRAEQLQAGIVNGEAVDADELIRLASEARRIVAGLHRRAAEQPPPQPTLREYLDTLRTEPADANGG